jgi:hypothetical protein
VDYSLFIMVAVLVMLEVGEAIGADSGRVFPSNIHWNSLCFVVLCFFTASS